MKRRDFVKAVAPMFVPAHVFGANDKVQIGQIGCGRIARASEFPGIFRNADTARFVAACDLDSVRVADAKQTIEAAYKQRLGADQYSAVKTYADYREMLEDKSIDAVCISTPDHWHAQPAMEAALAGKDVYLQKPASLTIEEGRHMADVLKKTGRILQIGSQQRADLHWRLACELVRNGRIGKVKEIFIGLPEDPAGDVEPDMPVPQNLNYDAWLGSTPKVPYTEKRVHPQAGDMRRRYDRPGWLRCEQFGAGMITGWGAHHIDIAHWAMDLETSGPVKVLADARFPKKGLWDVHGVYHVRMQYPNGAMMYISEKYPNGVRFIGEDGWIWVTRGPWRPGDSRNRVLDASDPRWIKEGIKDGELRLHVSPKNDHHLDWISAVKTRQEASTNAESGHRSCSACLVAWAAMRMEKELTWDPKTERFSDAEANKLVSRPQRAPFGTHAVLDRMRRTHGSAA